MEKPFPKLCDLVVLMFLNLWPTRAGPTPLFERGPRRRRVEPEIITRSSASWNSGVASWDEPDAVALGSPSDRAQSSRPNLPAITN